MSGGTVWRYLSVVQPDLAVAQRGFNAVEVALPIRRAVSGRPVFGFADTNFASLSILTHAARRVDEWPDRRAIQQ